MRLLSYEELKGSTGREVWYRPPRYEARQLFPVLAPRVIAKSSSYQLHDISLGGAAVLSKDNLEPDLHTGEIVPISIEQGSFVLFESQAKVCRAETNFLGSKIAFNFINNFVDFDRLLSKNAKAQIAHRSALFSQEKCNLIPAQYRTHLTDVLSMLRSYRALLDQNSILAGQFSRGLDPQGLFEACEAGLVEQWRQLWLLGNDIVRPLMGDRDRREAAKDLTELVLTPEMRLGAIWDRSYAKPLGYPGDFEMMNQVYDWRRIGHNVYEMLLHRLGLEVAECIQTRMDVVRDTIAETIRSKNAAASDESGLARILSLGCGPAREIESLLSSSEIPAARAAITLIDQESAALRYAYERTYPQLLSSQRDIKVQCLNMSFTNILRGTSELGKLPPQDLIYSVGLLDYLQDRRAGQLVARLYRSLSPGGTLIIGNMNETDLSNLWPMEFIADWSLIYRNEAQMLAWGAGLTDAESWTETEPTGRVRLLYLRKKAH